MRLGCKESVSLQSMDDPMNICFGLHTNTFGDNFIRRSYAVDTYVSLYKVEY